MTSPLYADCKAPARKPEDAHSGLWYERFFSRYQPDWSVDDSGKKQWIDTVTGRCGDTDRLDRHAVRQMRLSTALGGRSQVYTCDWHLATGLGNPHPVENGFAWHPTLGVPYLTGAAVKGLVRAWVEAWDELSPEARDQRCRRWFGSEHKGDVPEQAGEFIFFDALPVEPPRLLCDVMTPHLGKWYEKGDQQPLDASTTPADWQDPVPVPFLVAKELSLLFAAAPRTERAKAELDELLQAMEQAVTWLGVGAKTAVGYGVMHADPARQERLKAAAEEAEAIEAMGELTSNQQRIMAVRKELLADREARTERPGGPLNSALNELLNAEAEQHWTREERQALADLMEVVYEHLGGFPKRRKAELRTRLEQLRADN